MSKRIQMEQRNYLHDVAGSVDREKQGIIRKTYMRFFPNPGKGRVFFSGMSLQPTQQRPSSVSEEKVMSVTKIVSGAEFAKWWMTKKTGYPVLSSSEISCGVYQMFGLQYMKVGSKQATAMDYVVNGLNRAVPSPNGNDKYAFKTLNSGERVCAFFVFSDNDNLGNGLALAKVIREKNLGEISESSDAKINPNSYNPIRVWSWAPDHAAVRAFVDAHQWGEGLPERKVHVQTDGSWLDILGW